MISQTPGPSSLPPRLRLLIIDDDEVDRMRVVRMLREAPEGPAEIEVAVDKATGITALRTRQYDCVLLDFRLPDGDGLDLLKQIQAASGDCPPVIIQTTLDHGATAIETLAQGAQDYLVKGRFDGALLQRTIRYAIQRDRLVKERNRLLHELQEAMARVKTLEGILPTCAWCKKIKDERDQWLPFETYVAQRSAVQFTHGICPDCLRKVMPDLSPPP
jgi:DNA-binding NarL/FixJ family response regulator